jgi:hypothetical protein
MKDDSPKKAPTLRLVTSSRAKPSEDDDVLMSVRMPLKLRNKLKRVARVRKTTVRRLVTRAAIQIVAECEASSAAGLALELDD